MTRVIVQPQGEFRLARVDQSTDSVARLGPWKLLRPVGEGSLARVYQATPVDASPDLPAAYAIKLLAPAWENDPTAIELLRQEATVGRAVNHPHLIAILSASTAEPPHYLVMPWLEGRSLAGHLDRTRPIDLRTALWIARQIASALDGLALAGWIHGDVKPGNIFVAPDGHATLLDLGFARRIGEEHRLSDRVVLGTPSYMAPELLISASPADVASDVYSLGVVFYEMLSGQLPFDAAYIGQLAFQHRHNAPPPLDQRAPWLPAAVVQLVRPMLAKDPLRRPTPAELVRALTALEIAAMADCLTMNTACVEFPAVE
jgi:serine/threonine-protein kinase